MTPRILFVCMAFFTFLAVLVLGSGAWGASTTTIPMCKDVPAYTDCQEPNGMGGYSMIVYPLLTQGERVRLREANKRAEDQRLNTEKIERMAQEDKKRGYCSHVYESPTLHISTSSSKIEAILGSQKVEITRRMVCDAWGHRWILDDAENAREMTYAVMRYQPAPVHYICAVCEKKKYRQTINSTKGVVEP